MRIDGIDRDIVRFLLRDAALPKAELARRVGIAASAISERVKRLIDGGVIRRQETRLAPHALGFPILAFVFVTEAKPAKGVPTGERLAEVTGVEEVHKIAGDDCYLVKMRARSTDDLSLILDNEINQIETVAGVRTTIVLRTILEDVTLGGIADFNAGVGQGQSSS